MMLNQIYVDNLALEKVKEAAKVTETNGMETVEEAATEEVTESTEK